MATSDLDRIRKAHETVARLVVLDPVYLAIFERLEAELLAAERTLDVVARARAVAARQKASG